VIFTQVNQLYKKHGRWIPILSFFAGFLFDMIMLRRIDDVKVILQQAAYLLIAAALIGVELIEEDREIVSPRFFGKVWKYREAFLHFLLGTLLNSYAIFYFKSASALTSFFFIAFLGGLLGVNEFKRFGKSQTQVHVAFLSLCLICYLISLAPTLMGYIGTVPFLCAVLASLTAFLGYYALIKLKVSGNPRFLKTHLAYPFAGIQIIFVFLYFINAIPPVPLSVKYMGIYHEVKKTERGWALSSTRPTWKFWQNGDQTFLARPGDEIYCYAQVFSPVRFKDELRVRWLYWDEKKGWLSSDAIPMPVLGGREEGYRAVTKKSNFQPGLWRVQIETENNREIGRIGFEVVSDHTVGERASHTVLR
jgi:hypothetical protein